METIDKTITLTEEQWRLVVDLLARGCDDVGDFEPVGWITAQLEQSDGSH